MKMLKCFNVACFRTISRVLTGFCFLWKAGVHPNSGFPYSGFPYSSFPHSSFPHSGFPFSGFPYFGFLHSGFPQLSVPQFICLQIFIYLPTLRNVCSFFWLSHSSNVDTGIRQATQKKQVCMWRMGSSGIQTGSLTRARSLRYISRSRSITFVKEHDRTFQDKLNSPKLQNIKPKVLSTDVYYAVSTIKQLMLLKIALSQAYYFF